MIEQTTMTTLRTFEDVGHSRHVVSIGTFDGVHLGHQHLLKTARKRARDLDVPLLVVTFEPPPSKVIRPESFPGRLVTAEHKLDLLATLGISTTLVLSFTTEMMRMSAEAFLKELQVGVHPVELWVGEEFALGHNRAGNVERLKEIGAGLGFHVHSVPRVELAGHVVSSSRIRKHVVAGDAKMANALLGHPFRISGEVIEGAKVGRTIGYPTANVEPPSDLVALPDGIYVSLAGLPGEPILRPAMTYIGTRPALNTGNRLIETHLLDFSGNLYGMNLATDILERIRPDATFSGVDALIRQLQEDERITRSILSGRTNPAFEVVR
jgi:riboflavin kinase/FMN adenylyltransferase